MKTGIHPKVVVATVSCACGHTWQTTSTQEVIKTDLCSNCHPFYTGEQRIVDTAGQVERFMRRMGNRTQQNTMAAGNRRTSRNRANVPPPPQERRPARQDDATGEEGDSAETTSAE
jgi:large subunit ribosomal protein L31